MGLVSFVLLVLLYLGTNETYLLYCQKTYEATSARNIERVYSIDSLKW